MITLLEIHNESASEIIAKISHHFGEVMGNSTVATFLTHSVIN